MIEAKTHIVDSVAFCRPVHSVPVDCPAVLGRSAVNSSSVSQSTPLLGADTILPGLYAALMAHPLCHCVISASELLSVRPSVVGSNYKVESTSRSCANLV